ncbi:hypothetical protein [Ectobacillus panaciterrae]|nr:hypothetical protein [Ectobacillus panaciterrae]
MKQTVLSIGACSLAEKGNKKADDLRMKTNVGADNTIYDYAGYLYPNTST